MNKKGQAAMEFLLTYGWAILVVLLVISALVYFGVLSPRQFLPSKCDIDSPLYCADYQITEAGVVKVLVDNGNANTIEITGGTVDDPEFVITACGTATVTPDVIVPGASGTVEWTCTVGADKGTKLRTDFSIAYTDRATGFTHNKPGEILVEVE